MESYSLEDKIKKYKEYFTNQNEILKPLAGKKRFNSVVNDDIIKNKRLIFEHLELEPNLIRLAFGREGDCTCKSVIGDHKDMIHLRNMLLEVYPIENIHMFWKCGPELKDEKENEPP